MSFPIGAVVNSATEATHAHACRFAAPMVGTRDLWINPQGQLNPPRVLNVCNFRDLVPSLPTAGPPIIMRRCRVVVLPAAI